jgi:hypothetical protein
MMPTFGDVYEVSMIDSWCGKTFWRRVMEPADVIPADLHVPVHGASSDRRGQRHLFQIRLLAPEPWHIEQEMRAGPLHIYKSAFSCGNILRGVEEMMPTFGDVYEVSMIDGWCGKTFWRRWWPC